MSSTTRRVRGLAPASPRLHRATVFALLLACWLPREAPGQTAGSTDSVATAVRGPRAHSYSEIRTGREVALLGVGTSLLAAQAMVSVSVRTVPQQGLDPIEIGWSTDRGIVGNRSLGAGRASDRTLGAVLVLPFLISLTTAQSGSRLDDFSRTSLVYAETFLISQGITVLAKTTLGRARPYAYLASGARPEHASYDVSRERTFRSMPSGHSVSAWTGAAMGLTEHLLRRPEASSIERVGLALAAGALAGATSELRVQAGQHFPSDVIAGAGIGVVTGIGVPLLHRGTRPLPGRRQWLQTLGGTIAGTFVGVILAHAY